MKNDCINTLLLEATKLLDTGLDVRILNNATQLTSSKNKKKKEF